MAESPIKLANELMTINEACIEVGMGDVSGMAKTYCPFGDVFHSDRGRSRAFKVFPETNSAYCWACPQYFTPVKLIALNDDITEIEAANKILEMKNYTPPDYVSRWDALQVQPLVDQDALTEALKLACARMVPGQWETLQYVPAVAQKLTQCLTLVRKIQDQDQADAWFAIAKEAMKKILMKVANGSPTA